MKRILLTLAVVLVATAAGAQRQVEKSRSWSSGCLSLADFRGHPSVAPGGSFADLVFGYRPAYDTVDGIVVPRHEATAFFRPYGSWMLPAARTAARLHYHQLQFDLFELSRRELQRDLDMPTYTTDYTFLLADSLLAHRLASLDSASLEGSDTSCFAHWDSVVAAGIAALPGSRDASALRHGWGAEFGFSMGSRSFRGPLHDAFKSGIDFGFLLTVLNRRHAFSLDFDLGIAPLRDSLYIDDGPFYLDVPATDCRILFEYGYRFVDRRRWSLTPFVGFGVHVLDQSEDEDETFLVRTATAAAGLLLQYRFSMAFSPLVDGSIDRYDFDLMAKLFTTYSSFSGIVGPSSSGWGVYLQLGFSFGFSEYHPRR
ncbi:MAG: hypothetical protein IJ745_05110 [Bacteroidales bacterium]|nr:hypothetical protein [Bacteroidales bacterium]